MTEAGSSGSWKGPLDLGRGRREEGRHFIDRNRYVVLRRGAVAGTLGFGKAIANAPERLRLCFACRDHRIGDQPALDHRCEEASQKVRRLLGVGSVGGRLD